MRTIIVDDEKQIREGLRILVEQTDLEVVAEASTVAEAMIRIEALKPDLLLLDIQLQQRTGFELLDKLDYLDFKLVFITAYNEHAIKAFKYNAYDYLLKPIDPAEFFETIERLNQQQNIDKASLDLMKTNTNHDKVVVRTMESIYTLALKDILYCRADQGYTHFYMQDGKHIVSSKTLKEYASLFPEETFVRVHQSYLVNWTYVSSYRKKGELLLNNEYEIPVSVRRRSEVMKLL
jgi:Response regulator of the LytR/AlgR family